MKNINVFQVVILVICGFAAVIAMLMFSLFRANSDEIKSPIVMWGTVSEESYKKVAQELLTENDINLQYLKYVEKSESLFDDELLEALASGNGPDVILLPYDRLYQHKNKLLQISYESYGARLFQDSFVQGGDVFRDEEYIYALPLSVDPLVLYWNRTLFNNASIAAPPRLWQKIIDDLAVNLTEKDDAATVFKSAIALGVFQNITHAQEIIQTLIMQAGNPIVILEERTNSQVVGLAPRAVLNERFNYTVAPAESALRFYTGFADPTKSTYSWNTSLPNDREMFARGDLAMYIGRASEVDAIRKINPNLNFDVTTVPQRETGDRIVFGDFTGVAVLRNSPYIQDAFSTMVTMADAPFAKKWSDITGSTPVRLDILAEPADNSFDTVAQSSALWARAYLEPDAQKTESIYRAMIEGVVSGRFGVNDSINTANELLQELLNQR